MSYPRLDSQLPIAPPPGVMPVDYSLHLPWPDISFVQAFVRFWKKYAIFSGRASIREYWFAQVWIAIVGVGIGIISAISAAISDAVVLIAGTLVGIGLLAMIVPSIAIAVRRLHDTGKPGVWVLLMLLYPVGGIVILVFMCQRSDPSGVRFDVPGAGSAPGVGTVPMAPAPPAYHQPVPYPHAGAFPEPGAYPPPPSAPPAGYGQTQYPPADAYVAPSYSAPRYQEAGSAFPGSAPEGDSAPDAVTPAYPIAPTVEPRVQRFCTECGKELVQGAQWCGDCGYPVEAA